MGVRGAILAGGRATRFGGNLKGLELVGGRRILDRVADCLETALGEAPLLVANHPGADTWRAGLRVIADIRPGFGTLGGLYTAVVSAPAPVICVAWDMPFLEPELLARLAEGLSDNDVFIPASGGRRGMEPLCAAYGPACARAIEQSMDDGDLRAIGFHESVEVGILQHDDVRRFGDPERLFFNVNTADDLAQARRLI